MMSLSKIVQENAESGVLNRMPKHSLLKFCGIKLNAQIFCTRPPIGKANRKGEISHISELISRNTEHYRPLEKSVSSLKTSAIQSTGKYLKRW
jgi:hypothetical protein